MTPHQAVALVLAGVLAGTLGTAGGITSIVSYPALLSVGLTPLQANAGNLVALVACWPASAVASCGELRVLRGRLRQGLLASLAGAAVGTVLLLLTPASVFEFLVPGLLALGSIALAVQPRLSRWSNRHGGVHRFAAPVAIAVIGLYGGYFGAGAGIMLLATSLVLLTPRLPEANAAKNMFVGVSALASAAVLVWFGDVPWPQTAAMAVGLFLGSLLGPRLARSLPQEVVRWCVVMLGLGVALRLALP